MELFLAQRLLNSHRFRGLFGIGYAALISRPLINIDAREHKKSMIVDTTVSSPFKRVTITEQLLATRSIDGSMRRVCDIFERDVSSSIEAKDDETDLWVP